MATAFSPMPGRLRAAPNNIGVRSNTPGASSQPMKVTTVSQNSAMPMHFENAPTSHHRQNNREIRNRLERSFFRQTRRPQGSRSRVTDISPCLRLARALRERPHDVLARNDP